MLPEALWCCWQWKRMKKLTNLQQELNISLDKWDTCQSFQPQIEESAQMKTFLKSTYRAHLNDLHVIRGNGSRSQLWAQTRAVYNQHSVGIISATLMEMWCLWLSLGWGFESFSVRNSVAMVSLCSYFCLSGSECLGQVLERLTSLFGSSSMERSSPADTIFVDLLKPLGDTLPVQVGKWLSQEDILPCFWYLLL